MDKEKGATDVDVVLMRYEPEQEGRMIGYIIEFFRAHHSNPSVETAREDLCAWTQPGHELYMIERGGGPVGFVHICMRGSCVCWIEDIFVEEAQRRQGIAGRAIGLIEQMLSERGVEGVCMDVVPDNVAAIRLYHRLGFDRLSLVTLRKELRPYAVERRETIAGLEFKVKKFD